MRGITNRYRPLPPGFTLVELAIVMVVMGLLMGAVIVGQTMIRTARINSIISDISRYTQATMDFHDKYQAYPGDFPLAESFWGSDGGCPATGYTATPHIPTCNGDGDGFIDNQYEYFRAWQQLADAGMINGTYTGVHGPNGVYHHVSGVNAPSTLIDGGGFEIASVGNRVADPSYFDANYQLKLGVGKTRVAGGFDYPLFTPGEALGIDSKIDDGVPGTGNVMPFKSTVTPGCTTSDVSSTSQYFVSSTNISCSLNIIIIGNQI